MTSRQIIRSSLQTPIGEHRGDARQQAPKYQSPDKVIAAFNTWAFKREQPSDPDLLASCINKYMAAQSPIEFVLYWGKGPRATSAKPDRECLDYLQQLAIRIEQVYRPGAIIRLIQTDTHATLNGHSACVINSYFAGIEAEAKARDFEVCRLGDLVRHNERAEVGIVPSMPSARTLENLIRSAARWYRGSGDMEAGAVRYYQMNMVEKRAVESAFPDAVFVTFNGRDCRELFPDNMPIFYMYSLRKGYGVKPWFLDEAGTPFPAAGSIPQTLSASAA